MNSDTRRILRQFETYDNPNIYQSYYSSGQLWDRLTQPVVLVSILVLGLAIYYQAASKNGQIPPLTDVLWNALVYMIPARVLSALDRWLHPPLFPIPMLQPQPHSHAAKEELLRKILGMNKPGGIMMSASQAGRKGLATLSSGGLGAKSGSERPPGLGNWDNSCYQNSILQGLAALKPLPIYLKGFPSDGLTGRTRTSTVDTLRDLIHDLNSASNNGTTMWTPSVLKNMSTWQQQDAQEYYSKLLDEVDKEMAKLAKAMTKPAGLENDCATDETAASQHSDDSGYQSLSNNSKSGSELRIVRNPLEGLTAQRVACTACGYSEGLSMIPFNCITLNLGTDGSENDLYERLDSYTKVESIPGVECAKCSLLKYRNLIKIIIERSTKAGTKEEDFPEPFARMRAIEAALEEDDFDDKTLTVKCKIPSQQRVSSTKTKQVVIARPPQSLAIHMNRSVFDESTGRMFKNLAAVRFPSTLDLGPWCLGSADARTERAGQSMDVDVDEETAAKDEEQWLLDPKASMVAGDLNQSKITGPIYELRAVITHYGRHENGHYVCYRRHPVPPKPLEPKILEQSDKTNTDDVASSDGMAPAEEPVEAAASNAEVQIPEEPAQQWWRLSDQDVTKVDEEIVLSQGGVFMLFYDCVDPNSVLTSDLETFTDSVENVVDASKQDELLHGAISAEAPTTIDQEEMASLSDPFIAASPPITSSEDTLEAAIAAPLPIDD
jgi:ubiquitin carboxyl-terminal hydrolase 1